MRMRHLLLGLILLSMVSSIGCFGRRNTAYRRSNACCPPSSAFLAPTSVPCCPPPPCCP